MQRFLCISGDYDSIAVALCDQTTIVNQQSAPKRDSNKRLVQLIDEVLKKNNLGLEDLAFIGVNGGPAPYTSLRVVIATANGLHFATSIPLISIDALKASIEQLPPDNEYPTTISLFNAFNFDVFYAIASTNLQQTGYEHVDALLLRIKELFPDQPIRFIGNGTSMYENKIKELFGALAFIPEPLPAYPTMHALARQAWQSWQQHETTDQILPLYLKKLQYKKST